MNAIERRAQALVEENYRFAFWVSGKVRPPLGFSQEEWVAECMFCMVRAAHNFDEEKGRFLTLVYKYVQTHRANIITKSKSRRRGAAAKFVSLNDKPNPEDGSFGDQVAAPIGPDLVELRDLAEWAREKLDDQGREILAGLADGESFTEIGNRLRLSKTTIANIAGKIQHRLAAAFPWEIEGAPRCQDCKGPVLTRTPAAFCSLCVARRRSESMREYDRRRSAARRKPTRKGAAV